MADYYPEPIGLVWLAHNPLNWLVRIAPDLVWSVLTQVTGFGR